MGASPGEESRINGVAAQTIEAQPLFGQIKPSKRHVRQRAEPQSGRRLGEPRLCCARGRNGSPQKEKQSAGKGGIVPEKDRSRERVVPPQLCGPDSKFASGSKLQRGQLSAQVRSSISTCRSIWCYSTRKALKHSPRVSPPTELVAMDSPPTQPSKFPPRKARAPQVAPRMQIATKQAKTSRKLAMAPRSATGRTHHAQQLRARRADAVAIAMHRSSTD